MNWLGSAVWMVLCLAAGAAQAASPFAETGSFERATELYHQVLKMRAPGLVEPLADYSADAEKPVDCPAGRVPWTHAIQMGVADIGVGEKFVLQGPENENVLFSQVFRSRGVAAERIHILSGPDARRGPLAATFKKVVASLGCGDRVIFRASGHAADASGLMRAVLAGGKDMVAEGEFDAFFGGDAIAEAARRVARISVGAEDRNTDRAARAAIVGGLQLAFETDLALLLTSDVKDYREVVRGRDLSDFVTAVRNRRAHAVIILDTGHAALAAIEDRQRLSGDQTSWSFEFAESKAPYWPVPVLLPEHGGFTAFYAARVGETTPEMPLPRGDPDAKRYGLFSFMLYTAIVERADATPRSVAAAIDKFMTESGRVRPHPSIESTDPDLPLVAEAAPPRPNPIRILSPPDTRGAAAMEEAEIVVEGVVESVGRLAVVMVSAEPATLDSSGRFRRKVELKPGLNTIKIVAMTVSGEMFQKTVEVTFEGDRKALEGEGRRYALVIANQTYGGATGMPSLSTPFADAEALASVLTTNYGFETELALPDGSRLPLVLRDATRSEIEFALYQLKNVAGAKDSVLIFYAGHGVFEAVTSLAFWVPSDAKQGYEFSYLSTSDISAAVQRIQAGSVILISDSCYSGALLRGGAPGAEKIAEQDRVDSLLKLQARRSRILMSSGNNEPVADGGGDGHSIFARALLTGLRDMDHDAFSARELFDRYVLEPVVANGDQEPQFRPLERVGHEGGDFVFVRVGKQAAR